MANELRIGPVALDQKIDPSDPDEVGNIAGPQGARYDTLKIIEGMAAAYEPIRPIQALRKHEPRSESLDLDEVARVAALDDGVTIEGAGVKGTSDDPNQLAVVYVARYPAPEGMDPDWGRSVRGVLRYNQLTKSMAAFDQAEELRLGAARAARAAGGDEEDFGEDPRVDRLDRAVTELQDRLAKAEAAREDAEARAAAAEAAAEPYPGYGGANADDVKAYISGVPEGPERETAKALVRRAEEAQEKPRKGVLDATEPAAPAGE